MPRFLFAVAVACLAVAPDRAVAFGWHHACGPWCAVPVYAPAVVFAPVYPTAVYDVVPAAHCPVPCCPAATNAPAPQPTPPAQPPRVEKVPAAAEPAPPARDVNPSGAAVPRAADPTPKEPNPPVKPDPKPALEEPLPLPQKEKNSDGLPVPRPSLPTTPADPQFPPLKLKPPTDGDSSVSQSSPLTGANRFRADVYPLDGPPTGAGLTAGFHNRTDRDVTITVNGETVKLPARHSVTARVPAGFAWRLDGGDERAEVVPAGSAGVEVAIRY